MFKTHVLATVRGTGWRKARANGDRLAWPLLKANEQMVASLRETLWWEQRKVMNSKALSAINFINLVKHEGDNEDGTREIMKMAPCHLRWRCHWLELETVEGDPALRGGFVLDILDLKGLPGNKRG